MMIAARWVALLFAAAVLAFTANANAGTLQLRDDAHIFGPSDAARLRAAASSAPFDARIVTTAAYPDQASFSQYVHSLVSEPDVIVVGLDPEHHHVQVHFGTGSHVPRAAWSSIERSGNDAFKQGAWEQGAETILRTASSSVTSSPAASATESGTHGSLLGPLAVILVIAGVIGVVALVSRRRAAGPTGSYGDGPYTGAGPYPGGPGPYPGGPGPYAPGAAPYYGPNAPPQGRGMGALGGGLIGAGLGGLAGYELGKMAGERQEREPDVPLGGATEDTTNDGGSYDAGGGGSSWDDTSGGGDGGGFDDGGDSGGGGSDF